MAASMAYGLIGLKHSGIGICATVAMLSPINSPHISYTTGPLYIYNIVPLDIVLLFFAKVNVLMKVS
ncbi:hypothetical protein GGI43DRAFT_419354 [Trichoderma evansii]